MFQEKLGLKPNRSELELIRRTAELIGTRAARLSACGVSAICSKKGYTEAHVGADGSVFNKYPHFKPRGAQALKEILDWPDKKSAREEDPVEILAAEDGSGVGAEQFKTDVLQSQSNVVLAAAADVERLGLRDPWLAEAKIEVCLVELSPKRA